MFSLVTYSPPVSFLFPPSYSDFYVSHSDLSFFCLGLLHSLLGPASDFCICSLVLHCFSLSPRLPFMSLLSYVSLPSLLYLASTPEFPAGLLMLYLSVSIPCALQYLRGQLVSVVP